MAAHEPVALHGAEDPVARIPRRRARRLAAPPVATGRRA